MAITKTKTKTKKKVTAQSLLSDIGRKSTTKRTKSTTPQIQINDQKMLKSMSRILAAKIESTKIKSILDIEETQLREKVTDLFEEKCRKDSSLHTSVRLTGNHIDEDGDSEAVSLQFTQKRQCLKMNDEDLDILHSSFGEDYDDLFRSKKTIEIDVDKLTDKQLQDMINGMMKSVDSDVFNDAVSVDSLVLPKDSFFTKRILDSKIRIKARNASDEGVARMFKASFKA